MASTGKTVAFGGLFMLASGCLVMAACAALSGGGAEAPGGEPAVYNPDGSKTCYGCHKDETPGIVSHWRNSAHAAGDVGCIACHRAEKTEIDAWQHEGAWISSIVTPRDCAECHETEADEFQESHHASAGNILHSLDNLLAEVVEGHRGTIEIPHPHRPGQTLEINGLAFANSGCHQCHGSQVSLMLTDGTSVAPWKLVLPEGAGKAVVTYDPARLNPDKIKRGRDGRPVIDTRTWPNTGIGRLNLDGSRGSCTACHSRHDFSSRRARQPENCGKCHLGPDHPQKEIYEESKHGIAYRDLKHRMNLSGATWVLGKDYAAAPTCATCHMSATRNQPITHDPRRRISWNNRPPASVRLDTDEHGRVVKPGGKVVSSWQDKRNNMKDVCSNCHAPGYVNAFFKQYDDFVILYNEKYARPGAQLMKALKSNGLLTRANFDEKIEWTWFYLWHHEGRRARHGASMMAPDYAHWHGSFEVADRWYNAFIPEVRELLDHGRKDPARARGAEAVQKLLDGILSRAEHRYPTRGRRPGS